MMIRNIYRDVTLQQIGESDVGREIRVAGWIENIRDHGGVSFVDLRDMYGVLQIVMRYKRDERFDCRADRAQGRGDVQPEDPHRYDRDGGS